MRIVATCLLLTAAAGVLCSQTKINRVPVTYTHPSEGKEMFVTYCAVCHGVDGRGGGPAAPALKMAPADLTQLTKLNRGVFPDGRIAQVLSTGAAATISHGSTEMPVWGNVFKHIGGEGVARIRIVNLTNYLKSLQQK